MERGRIESSKTFGLSTSPSLINKTMRIRVPCYRACQSFLNWVPYRNMGSPQNLRGPLRYWIPDYVTGAHECAPMVDISSMQANVKSAILSETPSQYSALRRKRRYVKTATSLTYDWGTGYLLTTMKP